MQSHPPSPPLALLLALGLAAACGTGTGLAADNSQGSPGATRETERDTTEVERDAVVAPSIARNPSPPAEPGPSEPSPIPRACPDGPEPSAFVLANGISGIAQSETHLYWYSDAIYRQPKAGGPPEKVTEVEPYGGRLLIDDSTLYWVSYPAIFGLAIDADQEPVRIVNNGRNDLDEPGLRTIAMNPNCTRRWLGRQFGVRLSESSMWSRGIISELYSAPTRERCLSRATHAEADSATGTVKEPKGASISAGRSLARVRARLLGASSR
jgi:hypothetical protein